MSYAKFPIKRFLITLLTCLVFAQTLHAQSRQRDSAVKPGSANLEGLYEVIEAKQLQYQELQTTIRKSGVEPTPALQRELRRLASDVQSLRNTFANLATGGIGIIEEDDENKEFDWRNEIVLVTQPLLENLKGLTEKPRKIERLKTILNQRQEKSAEIDNALINLGKNSERYPDGLAQAELRDLQRLWQRRKMDNDQAIELSQYQLATLLGDNTPRIETIKKILFEFLNGRGLTLGLAVLVSMILWFLTRALLWLTLRRKDRQTPRSRLIRHRLATYGYTFFTTALIVIGVMVVLYVRGDLLLLALALVVFASIALSLRTILPRFIGEARLLLNIGAIREGERVDYQGLIWEVQTINVQSYLRNPYLDGVVRLPLSGLKDLVSRPTNNTDWFPSKPGEVLVLADGNLVTVITQTPEFVELKNKTGTVSYIPTAEFARLRFENLSRNGSYTAVTTFGIDYQLQDICLDTVPEAFRIQILTTLSESNYQEYVKEVKVEFDAAATSSLDYIIFVHLDSEVAIDKFKIERLVQQACVKVCNEKQWTIPFAQLTLHHGCEVPAVSGDRPDGHVDLRFAG